MERKKLGKLISFLCLEWRKKEGKKYKGKSNGKFWKMSGKNFPHIFVWKTEENDKEFSSLRPPSPKTLPRPRFSLSLYNPISLSSPRPHTATLFFGNGTLRQQYSHLVCPSLFLSNCDSRVSSAALIFDFFCVACSGYHVLGSLCSWPWLVSEVTY